MTAEGTTRHFRTTTYGRGTCGYRAPELMKERRVFNIKSDIWALGCIVHEILSGRKRFEDDFEGLQFTLQGEDFAYPPCEFTTGQWNNIFVEASNLANTMLRLDTYERPSASKVLVEFERLSRQLEQLQSVHETPPETDDVKDPLLQYVGLAHNIGQALRLHEDEYGDDIRTADLLSNLGWELHRQKLPEDAEEHLRRALIIHKSECGGDHMKVGKTMERLAKVWEAQGELWGAIIYTEKARGIYVKHGYEEQEDDSDLTEYLGKLYLKLAKAEKEGRVQL